MSKSKVEQKVDTIMKPLEGFDYDIVNNSLKVTGNDKEIGLVTKKTLYNICKWALNGASQDEIAHNLELTPKQFETLTQLCPFVLYIMQSSYAYADIIVAGTLFERAIGKTIVKKQVLCKVHDYDDTGRVIGEHYEKQEIEEQLPPEPNLLKFLAEHRLSEKFGEKQIDEDRQIANVVGTFDTEQLKEVEAELRGKN